MKEYDAQQAIKGKRIFVWVAYNKTDQASIEVTPAAAILWMATVASKNNGEIPIFIGHNEVFLGDISRLIV